MEGVVGAASEVFFLGLRVDWVHSGACWEAFDLLPRAPVTLLSSGLERKAAPCAALRDPLDRSCGMAQSLSAPTMASNPSVLVGPPWPFWPCGGGMDLAAGPSIVTRS